MRKCRPYRRRQTDEVKIISLVSLSRWNWILVIVPANVKQWLP